MRRPVRTANGRLFVSALTLSGALACGPSGRSDGGVVVVEDVFGSSDGGGLDAGDAASMDASRDASDANEAGPRDGSSEAEAGDARVCGCGTVEICDDDFDNDCDGMVNESCPCLPGTVRRCLNGTPNSGTALCSYGEQSCVGSGEFGMWGTCSASGPRADAGSSEYGCRRIVVIGAPGANPSSNFQSWLEARGAIVRRVQTTAEEGPLRRELLDTFDVAIIDWLQREYTEEESNALRDWVRAGGGLVAMSGHDSGATANRHISLLRSVGINYVMAPAYNGPAVLSAGPLAVVPGESRTLAPVSFYGGLRVVADESFVGTTANVATIDVPTAGTVVVGMTGDLMEPDGPRRGRVFVFGDEWIEFDSEWSTMPDIAQLWFNSINWVNPSVASRTNECE